MELTVEKRIIIELALDSYITELKDRVECFEKAITAGKECYKEVLESAKCHLESTVELLEEMEAM